VASLPDVFSDGVSSSVLTRDSSGGSDWMVMPGKSATKCYAPGNCKFSIHFMRKFETGDANDWELYGGVNQIFDTVGYFSSQNQRA